MIGIFLSFGLAVLMISFQNDNRYFFGILMSRGFGKRGILMFMLSQMIIVFLIAILSGFFSGFLISFIFTKLSFLMIPSFQGLNLPLYFDGLRIFEVLGLIVGVSFSMYIVTFFIQIRKSITQYMKKF